MSRMRRTFATMIVPLALAALPGGRAWADPIRRAPARDYPEVVADLEGDLSYRFDPARKAGALHASVTPYLMAGGATVAEELAVSPTADGLRTQTLDVTLDGEGRLLDRPSNSFEMVGTVVAGGRSYTGLLLKGVPTAFGAMAADPLRMRPASGFDLDVRITGGQLAGKFGPGATLRILPDGESTFDGTFRRDFQASRPSSRLRASKAAYFHPAPEPTTLAVLLAGGLGALGLGRLRCGKGRRSR